MMHSIFGSNNRAMFDILHDAHLSEENKTSLCFFGDKVRIKRGLKDKTNMEDYPWEEKDTVFTGLMHTHLTPFQYRKWIVGAIGSITNMKELNEDYLPFNPNPTETNTIASMCAVVQNTNPSLDTIKVISGAIHYVEGDLAAWIVNIDEPNNIYIFSNNINVYIGGNGSFSMIPGKNWDKLDNNNIYLL